jgi:hypothetical protein
MDIFSYKVKSNRMLAKCGVEIYQGKKSAIVVVTELPDNSGMSICNAFEDLFLQVCEFYKLNPSSVLWIEHWGVWKYKEGAPYDRESEEWHKVEFNWNGEFVSRPHWINVTASFVEVAKSFLE